SLEELQLAARNHGLPLEALRYDVTPVGLHYLLIHYDIPAVDAAAWRLEISGHVERPLSLTLAELQAREQVELVATLEFAGPRPPQHGFPLRLVVPGWYGMTNVKWLAEIRVATEPFEGYQQDHSYRLRQAEEDEGEPLTRMLPRALMVPPGIPEFQTRERRV